MNKPRFILLAFLIALSSFSLSGCWDRTEVDKLAIVVGVGVDRVPGKEPILLTVQVVSPSSMKQGKQGGSSEKPYALETSRGKTFFDAISNLSKVSSRKIYFDHTKVIILGKKLVEAGIAEPFDYMERNREFRKNNLLSVAENMAKDAFNVKIGTETIPANGISEIIKNGAFVYPSNLNDFLLGFRSFGVSIAPAIQMVSQENEATKKIKLEKTAVFKNYRLLGLLSADDSKDILWLSNKLKEDSVVIPCKLSGHEQEVTIDISDGKTKITPRFSETGISMDIKCTGIGRLREAGDTEFSINKTNLIKEFEQKTEESLKRRMENTVKTAQKKYNADFVGFSDTIHRNNPVQWRSLKNKWDQYFPKIKYNVHFKIDIINVGNSSQSLNDIKRKE